MKNKFSAIKPVELKCEYKANPIGIDEKHPRFNWLTNCNCYNSSQTAYQILVASSIQNLLSELGDVWDSSKVQSSNSTQIQFSGSPLISNTTYFWQVMVWNEDDESSLWSEPSRFSTGLFNQQEWQAKWISHIYKEEKASIGFQPHVDKWIWYPFNNSEEKLKTIQLFKTFQLEHVKLIEYAKLLVTADEKFQLYLNEELAVQSDDKIFSWARPILSDVKDLLKDGPNIIRVIGLNSYVEKPGFILRLEIKFKTGEAILIHTDNTWKATVELRETNLADAEEVAIAGEKPWRLPKVGLNFNPAAYFRKTFNTNKKVSRAFVYCSALGLYHLRINGKQVSEDRLTPGWSNFNKCVYYNSYDVTSILNSSNDNVINVILVDGYYSGYCGWEKGREYYGKFPAILFQLLISYNDGSSEVIFTDESWISSEGPIREADILMGEVYESNYESLIKDWESHNPIPNFDKVIVRTEVDPKLTSYKAEEVRIRGELNPHSIQKIDEQKYIIDFNQNFAGFAKLTLRNAGKRKITLRFAEMLNDDGLLYTDNIRMARAQDTYISRGDKEEIWQPMFTYHGFRYVEVSGLDKIDNDTVIGISINSLPEQTGYFKSSDEKLNKLFDCILWNERSNYVDIPTDCPQRDERFGWLGDAVSFFNTAAFNFDVSAFYTKWLDDLFNAQKEYGALPPFAPFVDMGIGPVYFNSAGWADAGIITPYLFYEFYNDQSLLEKYFERMKKYIHSLGRQSDNYILPSYGDWLYSGEETSKSFIATAYFAYDCTLMSKIASLLGHKEDAINYSELFKKIKRSFRKTFMNNDGTLTQLTQTAAVLSIHFDLLEAKEKEKVISFLTKDIIENDYHITTGFLGLSFLMPVLSSIGRNDLAWKVLTNNEFPSWFNMIDLGATTLWERWDSYHPEKGFYDPTMNSFNHCSLGCVGEWLFKGIAGINSIEPGFKKVIIKPFIPDGLTFAKASIKTIYGYLKSEWRRNENRLLLDITIPFNTQAIVVLPSYEYEINNISKLINEESGFTYLEIGSGSYEIRCKLS